jgi:hypothetical protein
LSGVLAAQRTAVHEGVVYAVSEVNARGGILGSSVKLVTRDDGSRPDEATEADAVRAALSQTDLKLPLEHLRFEAHGDPLHYEVGVFQIQKGRHVLLYPRDRATGKLIGPKP